MVKKKKNLVTGSSYLFQVGDMNFPCRGLNVLWPLGKEISNKYLLMGQFLNIGCQVIILIVTVILNDFTER